MTTAFADAAETMAGALGKADYPFAIIDHPVSSATDEGLEARARSVGVWLASALAAEAAS